MYACYPLLTHGIVKAKHLVDMHTAYLNDLVIQGVLGFICLCLFVFSWVRSGSIMGGGQSSWVRSGVSLWGRSGSVMGRGQSSWVRYRSVIGQSSWVR